MPEELLPKVIRPVRILWGEKDPWEPIEMGQEYANFDCVDEFVPLKGNVVKIKQALLILKFISKICAI